MRDALLKVHAFKVPDYLTLVFLVHRKRPNLIEYPSSYLLPPK